MIDFEGKSAYAKYESFDIGDMTEKYVLKVTRYSGTAGDAFLCIRVFFSQLTYQILYEEQTGK